jgi:hypothetical protein
MNFSAFSGSGPRRWRKKRWRAGWLAGFFALGGVLAASQAAPPYAGIFRRDYRPDNVFAYPAKLSPDLRRLAVLPLAAETAGRDLPEGCVALTPVLMEQLIKTRKFEVVAVEASALRHATGQINWTGKEMLPPDFFAFLRREYGCDAVLFAELTTYHAYAPLAIGWRLKLADARSGQIVWAADELFDANQPAVNRAAQWFAEPWPHRPFARNESWIPEAAADLAGLRMPHWPFGRKENWMAANSPRQFGRYATAALLDTLPER